MIVSYGGYSHGPHEATLRVVPTFEHSEIGQKLSARLQFLIDGRLIASSRSALLSGIREMERAYTRDGGDLSLDYDDGTSALLYRNRDTSFGIQVKRLPSSVESMGAEYACQWTYSIILEAQYINMALSPTFVVGYDAGLRQNGNGLTAFRHVPAKEGAWRKQNTTQRTTIRRTQFGSVTGLRQYPRNSVPLPLWPDDLIPESYQYEEVRAAANQQTSFRINYSYEFERNGPFPS